MKQLFILFFAFILSFNIFAFNNPLLGSWGIAGNGEALEAFRFTPNEIVLYDQLYRLVDLQFAEDTIYIENEEDNIMIQYFLLSEDKLLLIMTDMNNSPPSSLSLILTRIEEY